MCSAAWTCTIRPAEPRLQPGLLRPRDAGPSLLVSLRVLDLPDDQQSWRLTSIIRHLVTVPVTALRTLYRGTHLRADRMDALVAIVFGPDGCPSLSGSAGDGGG